MRRDSKFFKARQDMAIAISERIFSKCDTPSHQPPKRETVDQYLKRGGKINVLPPERRMS